MSKKYTVAQLKKICKEKGIRGYSKMKKAELMKKCLQKKDTPKPQKKKTPTPKPQKKKTPTPIPQKKKTPLSKYLPKELSNITKEYAKSERNPLIEIDAGKYYSVIHKDNLLKILNNPPKYLRYGEKKYDFPFKGFKGKKYEVDIIPVFVNSEDPKINEIKKNINNIERISFKWGGTSWDITKIQLRKQNDMYINNYTSNNMHKLIQKNRKKYKNKPNDFKKDLEKITKSNARTEKLLSMIYAFPDKVDWKLISAIYELPEEFFRDNSNIKDKEYWYMISANNKLSRNFIKDFADKLYEIGLKRNDEIDDNIYKDIYIKNKYY